MQILTKFQENQNYPSLQYYDYKEELVALIQVPLTIAEEEGGTSPNQTSRTEKHEGNMAH